MSVKPKGIISQPPADGSTITTRTPTFAWTDATDGETGIVSYTLLIATSSGSQEVPVTDSSYTPLTDMATGVYTWTVRAYDAAGDASGYASPMATLKLWKITA